MDDQRACPPLGGGNNDTPLSLKYFPVNKIQAIEFIKTKYNILEMRLRFFRNKISRFYGA